LKFIETQLSGAYVIELEEISDNRGFFARSFCAREFEAHGLNPAVLQSNLSYNHLKGTLRGMHFQAPPAAETKLVRCTAGSIWDVIVDIRPSSPTYLQHFGVELSAKNRRALYVPQNFAHGYLTLTDDAEVTYAVSEFYTPGAEGGFRHDDPDLKINWPIAVEVISGKDAAWPLIGASGKGKAQ
jgi:dTDP-4-dehydrorhamnose 3,5-epimerase